MPSWLGQRAKGISRQRGAALVIALLVMAVLLLMGTSFLSISSTEMEIARNAREAVQAFYVAEAGVARLKRDLLAQFTVPYTVPCANFDVFADLRRTVLISGEPLGVPGQQVDADGSKTCRPPNTGTYYPLLDELGQQVPATGDTWRPVTYGPSEVGGGTYRVEVRRATADGIEARVTAGLASATRAMRQIEVAFRVERFTPGEHALFVEGGIWRLGAGPMTIAGPVFVKGWNNTIPAMRLGDNGSPDRLVGNYKGMDAALQAAIPAPPTTPNPNTGEAEVDLKATLRVYQGPVEITSAAASAGEPTVAGNGVKESLAGAYTNHGFSGTPGADNVFAGNSGRFDVPRDMASFPDLTGPYTGPPLPGGATPTSHDAYLQDNALGVEGGLTIDNATGEFSHPPGLMDLNQCAGNCLIYRPGEGGTPPTLLVNGIIRFRDQVALGGTGGRRLAAIRYKGSGTIYARSGSADPLSGNIEVSSDLLPAEGKFPTDHRLGLISGTYTTVGDWTAPSPPLRIAANIFSDSAMWNYVSYQTAGAVIARYFYIREGVGVYYVPALAGARPPGMPGVSPGRAVSPYFVRTISWRDVAP